MIEKEISGEQIAPTLEATKFDASKVNDISSLVKGKKRAAVAVNIAGTTAVGIAPTSSKKIKVDESDAALAPLPIEH